MFCLCLALTLKASDLTISYLGEFPSPIGQAFSIKLFQKAGDKLVLQRSFNLGTSWEDFYIFNPGGEDTDWEIMFGTFGWTNSAIFRYVIVNP